MTTKPGLKVAAVLGALALVATAFVLVRYQPTIRATALASSSACQFQEAAQPVHVAFCDTFDKAAAPNNTRSGALDPTVWGVSRVVAGGGDHFDTGVNPSQGPIDNFAPVASKACGDTTVVPTQDVQICNGQLFDSVNDDGGQTALAMYPRQPFDIAGRTGTVSFDVSDNSQGPHAAWPTFVYTDQPVPAPYSSASGIETSARNSIGFTMAQPCNQASNQSCATSRGCPQQNDISVDSMFVTRDYRLSDLNFTLLGCVAKSTSPTEQNHVEVRVSQSTVQVWASDPGGTNLREIAQADNANVPLTRGLVWLEDNHYNGAKFNSQQSDTFGWDNLGFDGPILPRDLGFDVSDNGAIDGAAKQLGWATGSGTSNPTRVTAPNVTGQGNASGALVVFNWYASDASVPSISVNGNPSIATAWPFPDGHTYVWRTIAVPVPLSEIKPGPNTIAFQNSPNGFANIDIILQGAGGVPTCLDPSSCTTSPAAPTATSSPSASPTQKPTSSPTAKPTSGAAPKPVKIRKAHCSVTLPSGQKETGTCSGTFTRNGA